MRRLRVVALLAALALLAAGCGGDDYGDDDDASADAADTAGDQAIADRVVAAFEEEVDADGFTPAADSEDDNEIEFSSEECKEFGDALPGDEGELPGESASAESREYERGDPTVGELGENVRGETGLVDDASDLDVVFDAFADDRFPGCIEEGILNSFEQSAAEDDSGLEAGDVDIQATDGTGLGDESAGLEIAGSLGAQGVSFAYTMDIEVARVGRSAVIVMLITLGDGESTADIKQLVGVMVDELEAANV